MNADQNRMKFKAKTNYNKGFSLTRWACLTPRRFAKCGGVFTTEARRHADKKADELRVRIVIRDLRIVVSRSQESPIRNRKSPQSG
jgi:hypothetical protein